jgi:hypothetical protein
MILTLSSLFHCARAVVMGLALHAKAGKLFEKEQYKEALEVLELAEVRTARSHTKVWSLAHALEGIASWHTLLGRCCDLIHAQARDCI